MPAEPPVIRVTLSEGVSREERSIAKVSGEAIVSYALKASLDR